MAGAALGEHRVGDRPDFGAFAALVIEKQPGPADKKEHSGTTEWAGKKGRDAEGLHGVGTIKTIATSTSHIHEQFFVRRPVRPDFGWC